MNETMKAQLVELTVKAAIECEKKLGREITKEELRVAIEHGLKAIFEGRKNG